MANKVKDEIYYTKAVINLAAYLVLKDNIFDKRIYGYSITHKAYCYIERQLENCQYLISMKDDHKKIIYQIDHLVNLFVLSDIVLYDDVKDKVKHIVQPSLFED